jgi:opacity protein-like surface antigen
MFQMFSKNYLPALLAVLTLSTMNGSLFAWECCEPTPENRLYIGGFGGGIYSNSTKMSQMGTAFFLEDTGGPLAVNARGRTKKTSSGFGGAQIGYEWLQGRQIACTDWSLAPAAELEAYWYNHNKRGHLINATERLPEHDFSDSFRMHMGVYLANAVFSLNNRCWSLSPYIGGGIGATRISLRNAKSLQVSPIEPGINHFNSKRNDSSWAFAAQVKAGLRYKIFESFHIFAEYRYLFVDFSNYILGSTVSPTHAPTSPWNVKVKNIHYNAFAIGLQYDL